MSEQNLSADDAGQVADAAPDAGADTGAVSDLHQFAIEQGWKPEDQYDGPDGKWKPAKEWLAAEKSINRSLVKDVRKLRDQVDRMASTSSRMIERSLKEQAETIQTKFDSAVEKGDKAAAAAATREMRDLERTATENKTGDNPEEEFAKNNDWYGKDEEATAYAVSVSQREASKGKTHEEQLASVQSAVKRRFPELFETPVTTKTPVAVSAPNRSSNQTKAKGFSDLPNEARVAAEQMADMAKQRYGKDPEEFKKQYAKDYFENAA